MAGHLEGQRNGGAIALGTDRAPRAPGAGDAAARDAEAQRKKGLATCASGGGMGIAMCVER
jgi:hypothetical protein